MSFFNRWLRRKGERLIVQRQSPDWSAINSVEESVAFLDGRLFDSTTEKGREHLDYTRKLLQFWAEQTGVPFWQARGRLKEIAHVTWAQVAHCDRVVLDADFDATVGEQFSDDDWILFVDDDDWIAPSAFAHLAAMTDAKHDGVFWGRVRFDGEWQWLDILGGPLTIYTNNYAVRVGAISDLRMADAMQHSTLEAMYREGQWRPTQLEQWGLTVTNKSPCSWNYLHQSMMKDDPQAEFKKRLQQYVGGAPSPDPRVAWASEVSMRSKKELAGCLGFSRSV